MNANERLVQMSPKLAQLAQLASGSYKIEKPWWQPRARRGWLSVSISEKSPTERSIMWTTSRDTHDGYQRAFSVSVNQAGELLHYSESAITMHTRWGYGRGDEDDLCCALDAAQWMHDELCAPVLARRGRLVASAG